jgi:hypothetical protein
MRGASRLGMTDERRPGTARWEGAGAGFSCGLAHGLTVDWPSKFCFPFFFARAVSEPESSLLKIDPGRLRALRNPPFFSAGLAAGSGSVLLLDNNSRLKVWVRDGMLGGVLSEVEDGVRGILGRFWLAAFSAPGLGSDGMRDDFEGGVDELEAPDADELDRRAGVSVLMLEGFGGTGGGVS